SIDDRLALGGLRERGRVRRRRRRRLEAARCVQVDEVLEGFVPAERGLERRGSCSELARPVLVLAVDVRDRERDDQIGTAAWLAPGRLYGTTPALRAPAEVE